MDRSKPRFEVIPENQYGDDCYIEDNGGIYYNANFTSRETAKAYADAMNAAYPYPERRDPLGANEQRKVKQDAGAERWYRSELTVSLKFNILDRRNPDHRIKWCATDANYAEELCDHLNAAELHDPDGWRVRGEDRRGVRCSTCGDPVSTEDACDGLCLPCADAEAFIQNKGMTLNPESLVSRLKMPSGAQLDALIERAKKGMEQSAKWVDPVSQKPDPDALPDAEVEAEFWKHDHPELLIRAQNLVYATLDWTTQPAQHVGETIFAAMRAALKAGGAK